ncbi:MAG: hypothetical protein H7308_16135 [Chthonomonadaceae bacterium]|nr:hypothetical protein [Chthonomonadaceae bacterium]
MPDSPGILVLRGALAEGQVAIDDLPYYGRIPFSRYMAGIFVFLGLLGTVIGLGRTVSSLRTTIAPTSISSSAANGANASRRLSSSETANELMNQTIRVQAGINGMLSGIGGTFLCTMLGIFATIVLSAFNSKYLNECQKLEQRLIDLASGKLRPLRLSRNREEQRTNEELIKATKVLSSIARQLSANINPTEALTAKMAEVNEETAKHVGVLTAMVKTLDTVMKAINEERVGLDEMTKDVRNSAEWMAEKAAKTLSEMQTTLAGTITNIALEVRTLREGLVTAQGEQQKSLEELLGGLERTHHDLRTLHRRFESVLNDVADVVERSPLHQELKELRTDLLKETTEVKQKISTLASVTPQRFTPESSLRSDPNPRNERHQKRKGRGRTKYLTLHCQKGAALVFNKTGAAPFNGSSQSDQIELDQIKAIQIHHLCPGGNKVMHEFFV